MKMSVDAHLNKRFVLRNFTPESPETASETKSHANHYDIQKLQRVSWKLRQKITFRN